jgi:hypothetical protein
MAFLVTGRLAGPGIDSSDHTRRGRYRSARDISQIRIREHSGSLRCFMFTLRHDRTDCEAGSDGLIQPMDSSHSVAAAFGLVYRCEERLVSLVPYM